MDQIINYFDNIPTLHRSLLIVGGISFFLFLEGVISTGSVQLQKVAPCPSQFLFYTDNHSHKHVNGIFTFEHL